MKTDRELLDLLIEAIDYSFLQVDGSYNTELTYPVIVKVKYVKQQLSEKGNSNEKLCLRDCKIDGIILVKGMTYPVEWNPVSQCMFVHTVWGSLPLNDKEYKNIFAQ